MVEGGDWRIFICRGNRDPLEASWGKNHQTYLPFFLKASLDHEITAYLDFSKALHKMVGQRETVYMPRQVQLVPSQLAE